MTQQPLYRTEIIWDRATGDYKLLLDGQLQGFAADYVQGEIVLDGLVHAMLAQGLSLDARIAELSDQYKDARATGNHVLAQVLKRAGLELLAQKYGVTVDELTNRKAA